MFKIFSKKQKKTSFISVSYKILSKIFKLRSNMKNYCHETEFVRQNHPLCKKNISNSTTPDILEPKVGNARTFINFNREHEVYCFHYTFLFLHYMTGSWQLALRLFEVIQKLQSSYLLFVRQTKSFHFYTSKLSN